MEKNKQIEFSKKLWREESTKSDFEIIQGISVNERGLQQTVSFQVTADQGMNSIDKTEYAKRKRKQIWMDCFAPKKTVKPVANLKQNGRNNVSAPAPTVNLEFAVTDLSRSKTNKSEEPDPEPDCVADTQTVAEEIPPLMLLSIVADTQEPYYNALLCEEYNEVFQFRITLLGSRPPIWRRIQVPASYTFFDLHIAIQDAMEGWIDLHPHEFSLPNGQIINYSQENEKVHCGWNVLIKDHFSLFPRLGQAMPPGQPDISNRTLSVSDSSSTTGYFSGEDDTMDEPASLKRVKPFTNEPNSNYVLPSQRQTFCSSGQAEVARTPTNNAFVPSSSPVHIYAWKNLPELIVNPTAIVQERHESHVGTISSSFCSEVRNSTPKNTKPGAPSLGQSSITNIPGKSPLLGGRPKRCIYTYDFVDNWQMSVVLEQILPRISGVSYPICTGGKRRCPPEQCGGIKGYYDLLRDISGETPGTEKWVQAMMKLCDADGHQVTSMKYDPAAFNFRDVVFQNPRKRLVETLEAVPIHPYNDKRHESFLSELTNF